MIILSHPSASIFAKTLKNPCTSYVRPIVRGKNGKDVEFGAKVQLSCVDGYLLADHLSFDNFNESTKLQTSVDSFQRRFDKLPEHIAMDQIYGTRENRKYLEEKNIRLHTVCSQILTNMPIEQRTDKMRRSVLWAQVPIIMYRIRILFSMRSSSRILKLLLLPRKFSLVISLIPT